MNLLNILARVPFSQLACLGMVFPSLLIGNSQFSWANSPDINQAKQTNNSQSNTRQTNICPQANSFPKRSFETEKYWAYICLGDKKNSLGYFVRTVKNDNNKITIPLTRQNNETYTATNAEISYVINPYELLVFKNKRVVLRDRTLNSFNADGKAIAQVCPNGTEVVVEALTSNFIAYVCQHNAPNRSQVTTTNQQLKLHIVARRGNSSITVPLTSSEIYKPNNPSPKFIAVKGKLEYVLTPEMLKIDLDEKTNIKERVIQWN